MHTPAPPLPVLQLGRTDMAVTRAGIGAWAMGGDLFGLGPQDDADSVAAIRHGVERGINWIDTAAVYGLGHSEQVVATAIGGLPEADRPYVFTKAGLVWDEAAGGRAAFPQRVGSPESLRREVEGSLRRLHVERIDLYQMHWPPGEGTSLEEYWTTFAALRQEGKVRAIGLSNHGVAELELAEAIAHVDAVQPPLSLIDRRAAGDVVPWCAAHDTGVIVYSPMQSGLLSGRWSAERTAALDPRDLRSTNPMFHGDGLDAALRLVDALRPVAERHGTTVGCVAIAWTLAFPGVTGAIVGARTPAQIDGWLAATTLELGDDLDAVAAAINDSGLGSGPVQP